MPSQTPKEISTFDEARHFLENLRDGSDQPDVYYLGHLTGKETDGRYAARFDSIHTVYAPSEPAKRKAFTAKHRFAKLHPDFCRDLHTRFFKAFTSLGFDDLSWFSTADLTYLVQMGNAEEKLLDAEKDQIAAATQQELLRLPRDQIIVLS